MNTVEEFSLYRYNDIIGFHTDEIATHYLSVRVAKKLQRALSELIKDIESKTFTSSTITPFEITENIYR